MNWQVNPPSITPSLDWVSAFTKRQSEASLSGHPAPSCDITTTGHHTPSCDITTVTDCCSCSQKGGVCLQCAKPCDQTKVRFSKCNKRFFELRLALYSRPPDTHPPTPRP